MRPEALVAILIIATALNRYRFDIGSLGIRFEHIALAIAGAGWIVQVWRRRWRVRWTRDDALIVLYLVVAFVASILNAPDHLVSLRFMALMIGAVLIYWLVKSLIVEPSTFRIAVLTLVVTGVVEAIIGITAWLTFPFGINLGAHPYWIAASSVTGANCDFIIYPYGTLFEPNIFGSFVMAVALILVVFLLSSHTRSHRILLALALITTIVALGLNAGRGPIVAFLAGLLLAFWFTTDAARGKKIKLMAGIVALLAITFVGGIESVAYLTRLPNAQMALARAGCMSTASGTNATLSAEEAQNVEGASTSSLQLPRTISRLFLRSPIGFRVKESFQALQDWARHPWIGNGANTAEPVDTGIRTPAWISNVALMALHDTGIIGFGILLLWFLWLARSLVRSLNIRPGFTRTALLALMIGFAGLLIAYQTTTAFWLGYTWVYLGLIRSGLSLLQRNGAQM